MNMPPGLRASLLLFLAALLLGGSAVGTAVQSNAARTRAQAAMEAAARAAGVSVKARELANAQAPRLARLARLNVFAQASRLDWVDVLKRATSELGLPGLQWRLAARTPLPGLAALGFITPLTLDLSLLHEGDLVRLDAWLHHEAPGPWQLQACNLTPLLAEGPTAPDHPAARVRAQCEVHLYTLRPGQGA